VRQDIVGAKNLSPLHRISNPAARAKDFLPLRQRNAKIPSSSRHKTPRRVPHRLDALRIASLLNAAARCGDFRRIDQRSAMMPSSLPRCANYHDDDRIIFLLMQIFPQ
jgi:hypothetical protein